VVLYAKRNRAKKLRGGLKEEDLGEILEMGKGLGKGTLPPATVLNYLDIT
jgi:hypothetical protein